MPEIKDDPREVLALLNSLGFVGITATQLKAFMKDLKIYRKIKEREKQQRREEMRVKIINKQTLLKEGHEHQSIEHPKNNIVSSQSSNSLDNELVKVKIKYIPKKAAPSQKYSKATVIKADEKPTMRSYKENVTQVPESDKTHCKHDLLNTKSHPGIRRSKSETRQNIPTCTAKNSHSVPECPRVANKPILSDHTTTPRSKSVVSEPIGNTQRTQSALSTKSSVNSSHKSFIRPWRLQKEAQKNITNKKCDPVALYQKYQQEWKQISFPGEAKHSKVRWAVREKMLGVEPHFVPLSRKSTSMPILKKK